MTEKRHRREKEKRVKSNVCHRSVGFLNWNILREYLFQCLILSVRLGSSREAFAQNYTATDDVAIMDSRSRNFVPACPACLHACTLPDSGFVNLVANWLLEFGIPCVCRVCRGTHSSRSCPTGFRVTREHALSLPLQAHIHAGGKNSQGGP